MKVIKSLVLALLMAASVPAYGGAKETAARAEYDEATIAYNLGRFDEAAQHYEAAYKLVHDPNMLFNIAQSYRQAGKLEQALPVFRSFLREAPADVPNRVLAEKFVEDLKRKIQENRAKVGAPVKPAPAAVPLPVAVPAPVSPEASPPKPTLAPQPEPAPVATPDLLGQPNPAPTEPAAEGSPFYKTWWFWTAVGGAVVAGTVTAFLLTRSAPDSCDGLGMKCVGVK